VAEREDRPAAAVRRQLGVVVDLAVEDLGLAEVACELVLLSSTRVEPGNNLITTPSGETTAYTGSVTWFVSFS
jgi:hypothetical protein